MAVILQPIRFERNFLMDLSNRAVRPQVSAVGGSQLPELRIVGPAEPCDGRDGERPADWKGSASASTARRTHCTTGTERN